MRVRSPIQARAINHEQRHRGGAEGRGDCNRSRVREGMTVDRPPRRVSVARGFANPPLRCLPQRHALRDLHQSLQSLGTHGLEAWQLNLLGRFFAHGRSLLVR